MRTTAQCIQHLQERIAQKAKEDQRGWEHAKRGSKRIAMALVADQSGSNREHGKIEQLNQGMQDMIKELAGDRMVSHCGDAAVVSFNDSARVQVPFTPVCEVPAQFPVLQAEGTTHMGEGVLKGLELLDAQLETYRRERVPHYCPILWIMSDGHPYGEDPGVLQAAIRETTARIQAGELKVYAIAIGEDADVECLTALAGGAAPLRVGDHEIMDAMHEISQSVISASRDVEYLLSHAAPSFSGK